jgi:hypothetical protein
VTISSPHSDNIQSSQRQYPVLTLDKRLSDNRPTSHSSCDSNSVLMLCAASPIALLCVASPIALRCVASPIALLCVASPIALLAFSFQKLPHSSCINLIPCARKMPYFFDFDAHWQIRTRRNVCPHVCTGLLKCALIHPLSSAPSGGTHARG